MLPSRALGLAFEVSADFGYPIPPVWRVGEEIDDLCEVLSGSKFRFYSKTFFLNIL
jgi:hypothetical protein